MLLLQCNSKMIIKITIVLLCQRQLTLGTRTSQGDRMDRGSPDAIIARSVSIILQSPTLDSFRVNNRKHLMADANSNPPSHLLRARAPDRDSRSAQALGKLSIRSAPSGMWPRCSGDGSLSIVDGDLSDQSVAQVLPSASRLWCGLLTNPYESDRL